jgi:hypothetical protein
MTSLLGITNAGEHIRQRILHTHLYFPRLYSAPHLAFIWKFFRDDNTPPTQPALQIKDLAE